MVHGTELNDFTLFNFFLCFWQSRFLFFIISAIPILIILLFCPAEFCALRSNSKKKKKIIGTNVYEHI